jgi:hypothetical protein
LVLIILLTEITKDYILKFISMIVNWVFFILTLLYEYLKYIK